MQMAVQPQLGVGQQVVERVAKPRCAWHPAVARVGAAQAGRKVGDHHGGTHKRHAQRSAQPVLALQGLLAQAFGQPGLTLARGQGFAQVIVGGAKGLVAGLELARELAVGVAEVRRDLVGQRVGDGLSGQRPQRIKVGPQRGAHKTHATQLKHLAL